MSSTQQLPSDFSIPNIEGMMSGPSFSFRNDSMVEEHPGIESKPAAHSNFPSSSMSMPVFPGSTTEQSSVPQAVYNPAIHQQRGPLTTTPISLAATAAASQTKFNAPPPKPSVFPYLLTAASYGDGQVALYHIDSRRILLAYHGELELTVSDKHGSNEIKKSTEQFNTPHGPKYGYVFYTQTKKYMDLLDSLFGLAWRETLQVELPEIKEIESIILWEGAIQGKNVQLVEYSEKAVALMTDSDFDFRYSKPNGRLTRPDGTKGRGYIFGKKSVDELRKIIPVDFGSKYTKSEPKSTAPMMAVAQMSEPSLLSQEMMLSGNTQYTVKFWRYSPEAYALTFDPPADISNPPLVTRNTGLRFNGQIRDGFIFAKSNPQALDYLKSVYPKATFDDPIVTNAEGVDDIIPPAKVEQRVSDLAISLMNRVSSTNEFVREEAHGKIIYYGPQSEMPVIEEEILATLTVGDKSLVIAKRENF